MAEFLISLGLAVTALSGAAWVWKAEWERTRCAYLVFEKTHAELVGRSGTRAFFPMTVADRPDSVEGFGQCGPEVRERVRLPKLEYAKW